MSSRIIFLGTGGDIAVVGKQIRASGGIVVQVEDFQFVIDPGPGCINKAMEYGVNLRETTAILVSHAHMNHANDLNAVIAVMTHNGLDAKGVLVANTTVVNGSAEIDPNLSYFHKNCLEKLLVLKPKQKVGIENVEIHALTADHSDPNTIGFKLFTSGFVLSYTSDTKYSKELLEQYANSDIIIFNTVYPAGTKNPDTLSSDDVIKIIEKVKPKLAIITHFGSKMIAADTLSEAREIQKKTGIQVIAAKDGMEVSPDPYSAGLKQRTLNLY